MDSQSDNEAGLVDSPKDKKSSSRPKRDEKRKGAEEAKLGKQGNRESSGNPEEYRSNGSQEDKRDLQSRAAPKRKRSYPAVYQGSQMQELNDPAGKEVHHTNSSDPSSNFQNAAGALDSVSGSQHENSEPADPGTAGVRGNLSSALRRDRFKRKLHSSFQNVRALANLPESLGGSRPLMEINESTAEVGGNSDKEHKNYREIKQLHSTHLDYEQEKSS